MMPDVYIQGMELRMFHTFELYFWARIHARSNDWRVTSIE